MEARKDQIPQEAEFMTDLWNLRKKYYLPETDDKYWFSFTSEVEKIHEKYKGNLFVEKCLLGMVEDTEWRWRDGRNST